MLSSALSVPPSQPTAPVAHALSLLNHKNWRHRELLAQFLADDYDESRYLATTIAHSSSASLEQLSALLHELQTELHSVILTHHSSLLSGNAQILKIEGEVATVLRRVNSLRAALTRIQQALLQPFDNLSAALQQLQAMQHTAEHIRQAIRVLHCCDKLKQIVSPSSAGTPQGSPAASPAHVVTPRAHASSATPALRDLVKCASLLFEVQQVFASVNLNGVTAVDAQLPFLNHVAELLHNQGRRSMYEALRGASGVAGTTAVSGGSAAVAPHINQLELNYVLQLFYSLAPNPHAEATLRAMQRAYTDRRRRGKAQRLAGSREADSLATAGDEDDADEEASAAAASGGGVELALLLEELLSSYLEQVRSALRRIFDIASSAQAVNLQEAAKRSKAGVKKGATNGVPTAAAAPSATSLRSTLWDRLDSFAELLFSLSLAVWTVSKLLHEKRDMLCNAAPGVSFDHLYRVQKVLLERKRSQERKADSNRNSKQQSEGPIGAPTIDESLLHTFWRQLCELLRAEFDPIAASADTNATGVTGAHSSHNFLRTIFVNEYPRLHSLFERSIDRVAKYAAAHAASASASAHSIMQAAAATAGGASAVGGASASAAAAAAAMASFASSAAGVDAEPPPTLGAEERQQLLSSFVPFFQLYLSRALTQLSEPITLMFSSHEQSGAAATVPSRSDVATYLAVLAAMLESVAGDARSSATGAASGGGDPELQRLQVRAIHKSVQLFVQHAERMLLAEPDRDMFSSSHMPAGLQADGTLLPSSSSSGSLGLKHSLSHSSSSGGLVSAHAASSMLSPTQRNNLDIFAILLQLERELTESELQRKYPQLFVQKSNGSYGAQQNGSAAASTSGSWSSSNAALSPALAGLRDCWLMVRSLQTECLRVLLNHASSNLVACFPPLVLELDGEPGASAAVTSAAQAFASAQPPPDGSPAFVSFRRKMLYTLHIIFPLYSNMLTGGNSPNAAAAGASSTDIASRSALFQSTLVVPLHATLCAEFLHTVSLVPLSTAQAPSQVSDSLRAHHMSLLTLFEALMQQLHRQPKRSSRAKDELKGSSSDEPLPIDAVHAWKEVLYARENEQLAHFTSRTLDAPTLLHFLFTNCSLRSVPTDAGTGVPHTAPHRLLQMRVEDYATFVRTHNQIELFELLHKVYALLEKRIPAIPHGAEGRTFLREHFPNIALALKILTKH